jgi:hypothetical protein
VLFNLEHVITHSSIYTMKRKKPASSVASTATTGKNRKEKEKEKKKKDKRAKYEEARREAWRDCSPETSDVTDKADTPRLKVMTFEDQVLQSKTVEQLQYLRSATSTPVVHNCTLSAPLSCRLQLSRRSTALYLGIQLNTTEFGAPMMSNLGDCKVSVFADTISCVGAKCRSAGSASILGLLGYMQAEFSRPIRAVQVKHRHAVDPCSFFRFVDIAHSAPYTQRRVNDPIYWPREIEKKEFEFDANCGAHVVWNIHSTVYLQAKYEFDLRVVHKNWPGSQYNGDNIKHVSVRVYEEKEQDQDVEIATALVYPKSVVLIGVKTMKRLALIYNYLFDHLVYFARASDK